MVNTGRPSGACDPCKARHTKCDQRRPRCSRCERAGRACTGYQDTFDARLRDETHRVARRVRARECHLQSLVHALPAPYEQPAVALFLDNFVLDVPDARYSKGFLASLVPLLRTAKANSLLGDAVEAVGLRFLATKTAEKRLAWRAARRYVRSLSRLQAILYHEIDGTSTETMISVYLMGLYEMMIPPTHTVHPWLAHLAGLTSIIKARNQQTGLCFPGIGFFIELDSPEDESTWAINDNTPVDGWFDDDCERDHRIRYGELVTEYAPSPPPGVNSRSVSASLDDLILCTQPILQAAPSLFESTHPHAKDDVKDLLVAARAQLSSFSAWPLRIPDSWQPHSIHYPTDVAVAYSQDLYPGRVDVYQDLYVAAVWNTYRTTMLRLCDVIAQCGQYLETETVPFRETDEYQALRGHAANLGEDICASLAYHMGPDVAHGIIAGRGQPSRKALGGLLLVWPLYAGSVLSIVPRDSRAWMRRQLRSIGVSTGLAEALVLADTVDLRNRTDPFKPLIIAEGHVFMWSASMF